MAALRRICVFCGASPGHDPAFVAATRAVGTRLAERGIGIVYGGGRVGLMGALADAALGRLAARSSGSSRRAWSIASWPIRA